MIHRKRTTSNRNKAVRGAYAVRTTPSPAHEIGPVLERRLEDAGDSGYLFENSGTGKPIRDVKKSWHHALKLAGLDGKPGVDRLRIDDLRHTGATRLIRNTGRFSHQPIPRRKRAESRLYK